MKPTKEDIALVKWETIEGQTLPHESHRFVDSKVFDCGKKAGRPKALASKQLYHDEDGRTYLIERLNHQFFQSAKYPVVWDYSTESDPIDSDTIWYARNTYYISSSVTVSGCELRIEPGTFVKFGGGGLYTSGDGKIIARGKPYMNIVFTSMNDDSNGEFIQGSSGSPDRGDGGGIKLGDASEFEFCTVLYSCGVDISGLLAVPFQHNHLAHNLESLHVFSSEIGSNTLKIVNNLITPDPFEGPATPVILPS